MKEKGRQGKTLDSRLLTSGMTERGPLRMEERDVDDVLDENHEVIGFFPANGHKFQANEHVKRFTVSLKLRMILCVNICSLWNFTERRQKAAAVSDALMIHHKRRRA